MKTPVHTSYTSARCFCGALVQGALLMAIAGISVIPSTAQTATTELEPGELRARLVGATGTSYVYHLDESGTAIITGQTSATPGGAVYFAVAGGVFTATASVPGAVILFQSNTTTVASSTGGGAIFMEANGSARGFVNVSNVHFRNNYAANYGGAIYTGSGGIITANGAVFDSNKAGARGGAISSPNTGGLTVYANDATFINNTAGVATGYGGAIHATGAGHYLEMDRITAKNNSTINSGGFIYFGTGTIFARNALFENNRVTTTDGGAIYAHKSGLITVTSATFNDNSAKARGGAIFTEAGTILRAAGAEFSGNTSTGGDGGAIYLFQTGSSDLSSAIFKNNEAATGGAIYMNAGSYLNASNAHFEGNYARSGGGAAIYATGLTINVRNAVFQSNTSVGNGAAITYTSGTLDLTNAKFFDNVSTGTMAGAILNTAGGTIILGATAGETSVFSGNTADGVSSAIGVGNGSSQSIKFVIDVDAGGVLDTKDPINTVVVGTLSGTMSGGGLWKVGGTNNLAPRTTGNFTIQSGTMALYSGAVFSLAGNGADRFNVDSGATLKTLGVTTAGAASSGSAIIKSDTIDIASDATLAFTLSGFAPGNTAALLNLDASTFTTNFGTQTLNILGSVNHGETYTLLYAANATFDPAAYTILYNNNAPTGRISLTANNDNVAKTLSITASITNGTLTWTGTDGSTPRVWDIDTSSNWDGIAPTFLSGDAVIFTSAAAGEITIASNGVFVKSQNFAAGSAAMLVNGGSYTFNAADATATLSGSGNFHVAGAATDVTLNTVTSFSGTTILDGGRLTFGENAHSGALAVSAGTLTIAAGKTLAVDGTATLAGGALLNVAIGSAPALTAGVFSAEAGTIINITSYSSAGIVKHPDNPLTLISSGSNIDRLYTLLIAGQALPIMPTDESMFLILRECFDDTTKVQITTDLVWTNTHAGMAHGTFYIDSGTFTLNANLSDNTIDGAGMNGWDGKTLKKTGTGTLILGGDNTYTGLTLAEEGILANTGTIHGDVQNNATTQNLGTIFGMVANNGTFINNTGAQLASLVQTSATTNVTYNSGHIENVQMDIGLFANQGGVIDVYEQSSGSMYNSGTIVLATLSGSAEFFNLAGGDITDHLIVATTGSLPAVTNYGVITGSVTLQSGTFANYVGGTLEGDVNVLGTGAMNNSGTISGKLYIMETGARLDTGATSAITNDVIQTAGLAYNYGMVSGNVNVTGGSFVNNPSGVVSGFITVSGSGIVYNTGTFTQNIDVQPGASFYYRGGFTEDILNSGAVYFDSASTLVFAKQLIGSGTVFKTKAGTLMVTAAQNQFLGPVSVTTGVLLLGVEDAFPNSESITLRPSTSLNMAGRNQFFRKLIGGRNARILFVSTDTNFAMLTLGELAETGNFEMRGDMDLMKSDRIVLAGPSSGDHTIKMTLTGSAINPGLLKVVENNSGSYGARFSGTADYGMSRYTLVQGNGTDDNQSWFLADTGRLSSTGQVILQTGGVAGTEWHYSLDSLQKRMGEVRAADMGKLLRNHKGNIWTQVGSYELKSDGDLLGGIEFSETVYTVTAGADRAWMRKKGGVALTGVSLQMGRTDRDFHMVGDGNTTSVGAGAYCSFLHYLGWYADLVAKYDKYDNELNVRGDVGAPAKADYSNHVYGLSLEAGRIMDAGKYFWLEASLQAALGCISTTDYTTDTGIRVHNNFAQALQYRGRLRVGCTKFGKWVPYAKVALVASDTRGGETLADGESFSPAVDETRMELGIGSVWSLPWHGAQVYFEYEYSHASTYQRPWAFSLGYRQLW